MLQCMGFLWHGQLLIRVRTKRLRLANEFDRANGFARGCKRNSIGVLLELLFLGI